MKESNIVLITSWLRSLKASIFEEESLNVVSASAFASSCPTVVEGTASSSLHKVWIDCFNSLKVFSLFTCNTQWPITGIR